MFKYVLYLVPPEPKLAVQEARAHERRYRTAELREDRSSDRCLVNVPIVNRERHRSARLRPVA